ncbi:hypothetical protein M5689_019839 [Euphorbia peplus]|nr:hypothetical protein M5689_019839 [Euphorbia peplus]
MSGVSLATFPTNVTDETSQTKREIPDRKSVGNLVGSLRVIELQLVAFIIIFAASGVVPLVDMLFPLFSTAYFILLSRLVFPSHRLGSKFTPGSQAVFRESKFFRFYVVVGTIIGLFLPLAFVFGGFARGDDHAVRSATPHLFLLSFQILTENVLNGFSLLSPPVRALVPLLYTTRRIFVIIDWIFDVWVHKNLPVDAKIQESAWFWFGRSLAAANLGYFTINLFGFVIPKFLPAAFEKYFEDKYEINSKMREDKFSPNANKSQPEDKKSD